MALLMNALERGYAILAKRVPRFPATDPVDRRDWHFDWKALEAFVDWLDKEDPMGGEDGEATSPFVRRMTVHAMPWKFNEDFDRFSREQLIARGLDPDNREDAYDDWHETVSP